MRASLLSLLLVFAGEAAAACSSNNCLRAVKKEPTKDRNGTADCLSYFEVTVTPATTTIYSTTTVTRSNATSNRTTSTVEPSRRWAARHEIVDLLYGTLPLEGRQATVTATSLPSYASACSSAAAYSSACSCMSIPHVTVTASTPRTTHIITTTAWGNGTSSGNATSTGRFHNSTSITRTSATTTKITSLAETNSTRSSTGAGLSEVSSRVGVVITPSTSTASSSSSSRATTGVIKTTGTGTGFNATSTGKYMNATSSSRFPSFTTANLFDNNTMLANVTSSTARFANSTTSAPFLNITSSARVANTTSGLLNSTSTAKWLNSTITSAPFLNATSTGRFWNTTRFANATSTGRFLNTTRTTSSATPTATIDKTCGETGSPFSLRVAQPGGLFDGWYLKVSGDEILFTSSANYSSRFSVEGSGHLCAVGFVGGAGNAAVAVVETRSDGSAVYLVDGEMALDLEPEYKSLQCSVGDGLACAEGAMKNWVGCGMQLDLSSQSGDGVVVDTFNCTSVSLTAEYS